MSRRAGALALAIAISAGTWAIATPAGAQTPQVATFSSPGAFTFGVPLGVRTLTVEVCGAQGGNGFSPGPAAPAPGAPGARVATQIGVNPGETLGVVVGGVGGNGALGAPGAPGFGNPGGGGGGVGASGRGGGGGGGASVIWRGGTPVLVGPGGGGGGGAGAAPSAYAGGAGGAVGQPGQDGEGGAFAWGLGGGPATSQAPGAGGGFVVDGHAGTAGAGGPGGAGASSVVAGSGGGGGAGLYGGGGGGAQNDSGSAGGGGGGSALGPFAGYCGTGSVTIRWTTPRQTTTFNTPFGGSFTVPFSPFAFTPQSVTTTLQDTTKAVDEVTKLAPTVYDPLTALSSPKEIVGQVQQIADQVEMQRLLDTLQAKMEQASQAAACISIGSSLSSNKAAADATKAKIEEQLQKIQQAIDAEKQRGLVTQAQQTISNLDQILQAMQDSAQQTQNLISKIGGVAARPASTDGDIVFVSAPTGNLFSAIGSAINSVARTVVQTVAPQVTSVLSATGSSVQQITNAVTTGAAPQSVLGAVQSVAATNAQNLQQALPGSAGSYAVSVQNLGVGSSVTAQALQAILLQMDALARAAQAVPAGSARDAINRQLAALGPVAEIQVAQLRAQARSAAELQKVQAVMGLITGLTGSGLGAGISSSLPGITSGIVSAGTTMNGIVSGSSINRVPSGTPGCPAGFTGKP